MTRLSGFDFRPGFGIDGLPFGLTVSEVRDRTAGLLSAAELVGEERWHANLLGTGTTLQFIGPDATDARFTFAFTSHHAATFSGQQLLDRQWDDVLAAFRPQFGEPTPAGDSFDWAWESVWLAVSVERGRVAEFGLGAVGDFPLPSPAFPSWLSLATEMSAPRRFSSSAFKVDFVPRVGAGPVRFGMTTKEVSAAAGTLTVEDAAEGDYWCDALRLRCGFIDGRCGLVASGSPWIKFAGRHVVGQPTDAVMRGLPEVGDWKRETYFDTLETVENPRLGVTLWSDAGFIKEVWAESED